MFDGRFLLVLQHASKAVKSPCEICIAPQAGRATPFGNAASSGSHGASSCPSDEKPRHQPQGTRQGTRNHSEDHSARSQFSVESLEGSNLLSSFTQWVCFGEWLGKAGGFDSATCLFGSRGRHNSGSERSIRVRKKECFKICSGEARMAASSNHHRSGSPGAACLHRIERNRNKIVFPIPQTRRSEVSPPKKWCAGGFLQGGQIGRCRSLDSILGRTCQGPRSTSSGKANSTALAVHTSPIFLKSKKIKKILAGTTNVSTGW